MKLNIQPKPQSEAANMIPDTLDDWTHDEKAKPIGSHVCNGYYMLADGPMPCSLCYPQTVKRYSRRLTRLRKDQAGHARN